MPFSIFDSMPAEMPAAVPSSATVRSSDLRRRRTSAPIPSSSVRWTTSTGASEPVRRSPSESLRRRSAACRLAGTLVAAQPEGDLRHARSSPEFPYKKQNCLQLTKCQARCNRCKPGIGPAPGYQGAHEAVIACAALSGYSSRTQALEPELGALLAGMLGTLCDRGPDSAGFAVYGAETPAAA